ncbi:MAG TPA: hypothetical protein VN381_11660 [Anaerovoracaceae bacterium]|nr:hypothetical protein [Anaerovoracaceae bacterium]
MNDTEEIKLLCCKCNLPLELGKQELRYQKQTISTNLLKCPKCGQIYISEVLTKGKMFEVEKALEEK